MENIVITIDRDGNKYIQIDRGNGEFTSMPKSIYDEMIASQAKPTL